MILIKTELLLPKNYCCLWEGSCHYIHVKNSHLWSSPLEDGSAAEMQELDWILNHGLSKTILHSEITDGSMETAECFAEYCSVFLLRFFLMIALQLSSNGWSKHNTHFYRFVTCCSCLLGLWITQKTILLGKPEVCTYPRKICNGYSY